MGQSLHLRHIILPIFSHAEVILASLFAFFLTTAGYPRRSLDAVPQLRSLGAQGFDPTPWPD